MHIVHSQLLHFERGQNLELSTRGVVSVQSDLYTPILKRENIIIAAKLEIPGLNTPTIMDINNNILPATNSMVPTNPEQQQPPTIDKQPPIQTHPKLKMVFNHFKMAATKKTTTSTTTKKPVQKE